ncbi:MAG: hypothetical protein V4674_00280 [Patescibacteria group bacterium]
MTHDLVGQLARLNTMFGPLFPVMTAPDPRAVTSLVFGEFPLTEKNGGKPEVANGIYTVIGPDAETANYLVDLGVAAAIVLANARAQGKSEEEALQILRDKYAGVVYGSGEDLMTFSTQFALMTEKCGSFSRLGLYQRRLEQIEADLAVLKQIRTGEIATVPRMTRPHAMFLVEFVGYMRAAFHQPMDYLLPTKTS